MRTTDNLGGCNGGRIRFSPQKDWTFNAGMDTVVAVLDKAVRAKFPTLTYADLIVLAGTVAVEEALKAGSEDGRLVDGGAGDDEQEKQQQQQQQQQHHNVSFCGGRGDAKEGYPDGYLRPGFNLTDTVRGFDFDARFLGLTDAEWVALQARPRSPSQMARMGFPSVTDTHALERLDNAYFRNLLNEVWSPAKEEPQGLLVNADGTLFMTTYDMLVLWDPVRKAVAQQYAENKKLFAKTFASAWAKLMDMDRFTGPTTNQCNDKSMNE